MAKVTYTSEYTRLVEDTVEYCAEDALDDSTVYNRRRYQKVIRYKGIFSLWFPISFWKTYDTFETFKEYS